MAAPFFRLVTLRLQNEVPKSIFRRPRRSFCGLGMKAHRKGQALPSSIRNAGAGSS